MRKNFRYEHHLQTYTFDREEYLKVMAQIINEAELELKKNEQDITINDFIRNIANSLIIG